MVDRLRANARSIGLANLQVKVMDGQALDLEDDSFDFSGSQLGLMLFPDRERGLAELHRVTRPGGQALVVVFGPVQAVEGFLYFFRAVKSAVPTFTPPANSPIFSLQDPAQVRREMAAAGFDEVRVETVDHKLEVKSAVRLWDMLTSATPPLGALAASLSAEQRAAAKAALAKLLQERMEGTAALLNMRFHIGIGTV
jgi:SAM-dependent methyltransferase